jgi:hypothetical protein
MDTHNHSNRRNDAPQSCTSVFCGGVSYRAGDMRSVILNGNNMNMATAIQESIDHTFGKITLEDKLKSDLNADEFKPMF